MIKKDEVYVLEQPKKIINAVVIVTNLFPLDKKIHDGLNELKKIADITFIFNSYHFPNTNNVDKRKFSQLYEASSFVDSKNNLGISLELGQNFVQVCVQAHHQKYHQLHLLDLKFFLQILFYMVL